MYTLFGQLFLKLRSVDQSQGQFILGVGGKLTVSILTHLIRVFRIFERFLIASPFAAL